MAHGTDDLAAACQHFFARLLFEIVSECIVGGDEEPGLGAGREHATCQRVTIGPSVVGPVHEIRRALCTREQRGAGARTNRDLVLFTHDVADRQRNCRVGHVDDHVDTFDIEPASRDAGADVGLVLVITRSHLHFALRLFRKVLGRHLRGDHRTRPLEVGIDAGHVVENTDPQRAICFGESRHRKQGDQNRG